jgi:hypothetical protein
MSVCGRERRKKGKGSTFLIIAHNFSESYDHVVCGYISSCRSTFLRSHCWKMLGPLCSQWQTLIYALEVRSHGSSKFEWNFTTFQSITKVLLFYIDESDVWECFSCDWNGQQEDGNCLSCISFRPDPGLEEARQRIRLPSHAVCQRAPKEERTIVQSGLMKKMPLHRPQTYSTRT